MSRDHRRDYHLAWPLLTSPARPHPNVVAAVREQIKDCPGRVLLLGVTPELADVAPDLIALDRNASMVEHVWPGNTARRRVLVGDWRRPAFRAQSFAACVGDTCLGALAFPEELTAFLGELAVALRPGGKLVTRVNLSPDVQERVEDVKAALLAGAIRNFHAFKFRLGMALIDRASQPRVRVEAILNAFEALFPDRDALAAATGWERAQIDTIEFYRGSSAAFSFPTRAQLMAEVSKVLVNGRYVASDGYEFAEYSPLLVAERG
ncbi:MAG: methyltransferase type 11 [Proteobacteria bacterium]|nr:MAG: methyltransferase type 11 [Pseudomonadota bacterium]